MDKIPNFLTTDLFVAIAKEYRDGTDEVRKKIVTSMMDGLGESMQILDRIGVIEHDHCIMDGYVDALTDIEIAGSLRVMLLYQLMCTEALGVGYLQMNKERYLLESLIQHLWIRKNKDMDFPEEIT